MAYDALINLKNSVKLPGLTNVTDEQLFYISAGRSLLSLYFFSMFNLCSMQMGKENRL
jgi:hypothetical protein